MPSTLVLFDIDGTLLEIRGIGPRAFSIVLEDLFGWQDDLEYISFAGATDRLVMEEVFRRNGHEPTAGDMERVFEALPAAMEEKLRHLEASVLPGADELLGSLRDHDEVALGLVTGNIEACAHIKLRHAGLGGHFEVGGYGDDHPQRSELVRLAIERAQAHHGRSEPFERVVLVGDSPSDVEAAQANGVTVVAVATGKFDQPALDKLGADWVLQDLRQTEEVLALLLNGANT